MSKKKWLALIVGILALAFAVYKLNVIPQYTDTVNAGYTTVLGWFGTNPYAVAGAGASIVGAIFTTYKVVHDKATNAINSIQQSASSLNSQLNNANVALQTKYSELDLQYQQLTGKLAATQSEVEATKATLAETQQKLADATTELMRKQDEYNASLCIKAITASFPSPESTVH